MRWILVTLTSVCLSWSATPAPAQESGDSDGRLQAWIERRLRQRPKDASAWRMLGRMLLKQGRLRDAQDALERSVELEPTSAAAHYDLGRTLKQRKNSTAARRHLESVLELAPESEYADDARKLLAGMEAGPAGVKQAGYEIREFDGTQLVEPRIGQSDPAEARLPRPFEFRLESGVLYNSNVALSPLSRELSPDEPASTQGFLAPDLLVPLIDRTTWRAGTTLRGHFTLNEGSFREFNLQSYQPGLFVESFHAVGDVVLVPRVAYGFTHDEFDGTTFGNRHAISASTWVSWNDREATLLFWTVDHSDFAIDGLIPSVTSQDGWTNTVGISHDHRLQTRSIRLVRVGADFTHADARGSDYRFNGVQLFAETIVDVTEDVDLRFRGGWGYRDYPDFEFSPSRNENIWRGGAELRKRFGEHVSVSLVLRYVRFDSDNPLFEAERYLAGLVTTLEY